MPGGRVPPAVKLAGLAALAAFLFLPRRSDAAVFEPNPIPSWSNDPMDTFSPYLGAFLYMIRTAEHEPRFEDWQRYGLFYTSIPFENFADHPVNTGELKPVRLPDRLCAPSGLNPPCYSSAAGAYQIIRPTWNRVRQAGAWGPRLEDFSPINQDEAARRLLIEAGALGNIESGNIEGAIRQVSRIWASLPGSSAMQNPKSLDRVLAYFDQGLERYG